MEKLVIQEELKNCPGIVYFPEINKLKLVGRSIPENPERIFSRLDEWITLHFEKNDGLDVLIQLEYINSGSSKYLYEILKRFTGYGNIARSVEYIYQRIERRCMLA